MIESEKRETKERGKKKKEKRKEKKNLPDFNSLHPYMGKRSR